MLFNFAMLLLVVPMGCYASSLARRRRGNRPVDRAGARLQLDVTAQPALRAKSGNYEYLWRADVSRPESSAQRMRIAHVGRSHAVSPPIGTHNCRVCN